MAPIERRIRREPFVKARTTAILAKRLISGFGVRVTAAGTSLPVRPLSSNGHEPVVIGDGPLAKRPS
jgi:hypothetical protein